MGGRLGHVLFYHPLEYLHDPLEIFKTWNGGMSFHGGLLGVICALWLFARKTKILFLSVTDFIVLLVPLGLGFGRIGNFINGELWGTPTNQPWGMVFYHVDQLPRHPSQLYELLLEGLLLFIIVWCYAKQRHQRGYVSAIFLISYAILRCFAECFREPDAQLGYLAFHWLTMGKLLSIPMLIAGLYLLWAKK